jgi:hypothetical protein
VIPDADDLLAALRRAHIAIRDAVVAACERQSMDTLAAPVAEDAGDTIFALDRISEETLVQHFDVIATRWPCVLIAEGIAEGRGRLVLPRGRSAADVALTIIVDPIDGTRGLMYQKRPAWILTGVAPVRGDARATLADIQLAVQTEVPLVKQHLCDTLWVVNGTAGGERYNRVTGQRTPLAARPSRATTIVHGFGAISRFFQGARDVSAAVDDGIAERVLGRSPDPRAQVYEDQYICTGGQLYELMMGHDRWVADLRPLFAPELRARGQQASLCCHPYDLCTESIARAAGVVITDPRGERLNATLDTTADVAWLGFANASLQRLVYPALRDSLAERGIHV